MSIHPVSTCLRQDKIFWQTEQDDEYYPSPFPPFILIRWRTRNLPISCTQPQIPVKHFVHMPGLYLTAPKQRGGSHGYTVHRGGRRQQLSHCSPLTSQRHSKVENKALGKYFWRQSYISTKTKPLQDTWLKKFCLISSDLSPRALILRGLVFLYTVCDHELKNRLEAPWE